MKKTFFLSLIIFIGCASSFIADPVELNPDADKVRIYHKADPPHGCKEIGPFVAIHGKDGLISIKQGDYYGAINILRNEAYAKGANTVLILNMIPPHHTANYNYASYKIESILYKCKK